MQTLALLAVAEAPQAAPEASRTNGGSNVAIWIAVAVAIFAGRQGYRRSRASKEPRSDQGRS